jgi:hypothetical protein
VPHFRDLSRIMGVLAAAKKNKIGAVVVSVFDWYRTLYVPELYRRFRSDLPLQRHTIRLKRRGCSGSLTWPSLSLDVSVVSANKIPIQTLEHGN